MWKSCNAPQWSLIFIFTIDLQFLNLKDPKTHTCFRAADLSYCMTTKLALHK